MHTAARIVGHVAAAVLVTSVAVMVGTVAYIREAYRT